MSIVAIILTHVSDCMWDGFYVGISQVTIIGFTCQRVEISTCLLTVSQLLSCSVKLPFVHIGLCNII